jgi:L,D-transpeptidase catalytic domain
MRPVGARRRRLAAAVAVTACAFVLSPGSGVAAASNAATPSQAATATSASGTTTAPSDTGAVAPTSTTPTPASSPAAKPTRVLLSNERTFTTWAHPVADAPIRVRPQVGSRTLARTHLATEDGFPEVYVLLSSFTDPKGHEWVRVRIPGRPNGRTGWVTRESLGEFRVTHWLVEIVLHSRRLKAYDKGKLRFSAPVGVGKPSTPTPTGHFYIREIFKLSSRGNPYWPYAMGTSDYSTLTDWPGGGVVGIHGDFGEPKLIPGDPSHGCVRMHTGDLAWLAPRLTLGTPLHITR